MALRRLLSLLFVPLLALGLLGACSSDDGSTDDDTSDAATDDSVADGAVEAAQPEATTVEHEYGTTEVPADPQAIAALGEEYLLADLFSLGLGDRVIVSTSTVGDPSTLDDLGFDTSDIEFFVPQDTDIEALAVESPDLILAPPYVVDQVGYDVLNAIAPTVPLLLDDDWKANYEYVASIFGPQIEGVAAEQLEAYDEAVAIAGDTLGAEDRTVSVATIYVGRVVAWAEGPVDVPSTLLDMGFTLAPGASDGDPDSSGRIELSLEQLGMLDGEDLVLLQTDAVEGEDEAIAEIEGEQLWQNLPAVEAGNVITLDRLGYPGLPGRLALVGVLETELAQ